MVETNTYAQTGQGNMAQHADDGDDMRTISASSFSETSFDNMSTATAQNSDPLAGYLDAWSTRAYLCHGIRLQGAGEGSFSSFIPSRLPVAFPKEPISGRLVSTLDMKTTATTSKTETSLMRLGMSQNAARTSAPLISYIDNNQSMDEEPAIHVTCRRVYTRVVITCDIEDLQPNPAFIAATENALRLPTKEGQADGLRRVLRQWGVVFATSIELGCALVTSRDFYTPCDIPGFGQTSNPRDIAAQQGAQKLFHYAAQYKFETQSPGHSDSERDFFCNHSLSLSWRPVGGTPEMHLTNKADLESLQSGEF